MSLQYALFTIIGLWAISNLSANGQSVKTKITTSFNSKKYIIDTYFTGNFFAALKYCQSNNMELVSIETPEENDFLFKNISANIPNTTPILFWISGNKLIDNITWSWFTTNEPVKTFYWYTGEPNNVPYDSRCLCLCYGARWFGRLSSERDWWGDTNCFGDTWYPTFVICEQGSRRHNVTLR